MENVITHSTNKTIQDGSFFPLGATSANDGINFAIYSCHATDIFLVLYDSDAKTETDCIKMPGHTRNIFHVFVNGIKPGQLYGYRVRGPFDPARGFRFNENKLLIDPYAKALNGKFSNSDNLLLGYRPRDNAADLSFDDRDSSPIVPKCIVIDDAFDWQGDIPLSIPPEKLVLYECHAKGFTASKSSGVNNPGTYIGITEKLHYLKSLGINAIELLPCHEYYIEDFLRAKGLTNYWGYNTLAFFAPELGYSSQKSPGCQVSEFKTMVRECHKAGIEVILDVVYNHTCEGNEQGPTLSLKGIDNTSYYILCGSSSEPGRYYMNHTGCGNSLNLSSTAAMRLVMDSLRYWVETMHVDGFRFDLASVLGREEGGFRACSSFFDAVSQDPVLSRIKLIAEPWDLATYQVGNFPVEWMEWNGRFRDTVRQFGKGDPWQIRELGYRLTGSADLYSDDGRSAYASVNFITCHDGFTLYDLLSYNSKHNDANLENNRDGTNDNLSWNCGAEGDTDNLEIIALRKKLAKNYFCYLLFSAGTPMILGGDEFLRTQKGNNNAYCQDNDLSWFDWSLAEKNADIVEFVRKCIAFRAEHSCISRKTFFTGKDPDLDGQIDLQWFDENGYGISWGTDSRTLCYSIDAGDSRGSNRDYSLFFALNSDYNSKTVILPNAPKGQKWFRIIDTSKSPSDDFVLQVKNTEIRGNSYCVADRSVTVFQSMPV